MVSAALGQLLNGQCGPPTKKFTHPWFKPKTTFLVQKYDFKQIIFDYDVTDPLMTSPQEGDQSCQI